MTEFVDGINQLARETAPAEGPSFTKHPDGEFNGMITGITKKGPDENVNKTRWEFAIKTASGTARYTLWSFTEQEWYEAQSDAQKRDMMVNSIARTKRMFVDLGLNQPSSWSQGADSILGMMGALIGKRCWVVCRPNPRRLEYQQVFINAPRDHVADQPAPIVETPPVADPPPPQPLTPGQEPPAQVGQPGSQGVSLDDIPF
jgi:hypothetical protein